MRKFIYTILSVLLFFTACNDDDNDHNNIRLISPDDKSIAFYYTPKANDTELTLRAIANSVRVDWGDGTVKDYNDVKDRLETGEYAMAPISHIYQAGKTYIVRISTDELTSVYFAQNNYNVTGLEIGYCPKLEELWVSVKNMRLIQVKNCPVLSTFMFSLEGDFDDVNECVVDISECEHLKQLYLGGRVSSVDLSKNIALEHLTISNTTMKTLDLSNNKILKSLHCTANEFGLPDLKNNPMLLYLDCYDSKLTTLDISHNPELIGLYCSYNELRSLDLKNNNKLNMLYIDNNQFDAMVLNSIMGDLPPIIGEDNHISISKNPGESACNKSIAENKGWVFKPGLFE